MITVVMPVYILNEHLLRLTEEAIASLGKVFLILIDNASPMGGGYLRSKADLYIRNKENLGFAKAMNQGLILSDNEYTALVSNDVRVSPNWQKVATKVLDKKGVYSCHFRMTNYDVPFAYGKTIAYTGKERWCTAACFVVNKGYNFYFDEQFFNSFEDWDLLLRVRKTGLQTAYTDKACFQHNHSSTQAYTGFKGTEENRAYFTKKHGEDPDVLLEKLYPEQCTIPYWEGFAL